MRTLHAEKFDHTPSRIYQADAVVVGLGAMGLMLTKYLTDFGQDVVALESSPRIADGPSIKNHGWLHSGVIHAMPKTSDPVNERHMVKALQYGHRFFSEYAPECLDQPFQPTYALTNDEERAGLARKKWREHGVRVQEIDKNDFLSAIEPGMNPDEVHAVFENDDARMNNRLMYQKLLTDVQRKGAMVLRATMYEHLDDTTIALKGGSQGSTAAAVRAPLFFYATGPNTDETYRKLTGEDLKIDYYKSHLMMLPRVTNESLVSLDADGPIIINHGDVSVVNRARDDVRTDGKDVAVDPDEVRRAFSRLCEVIPSAYQYRDDIHAIACIKPSITSASLGGKHSVASTHFEPVPGHHFMLPGKMTLAPYAAAEAVRLVADQLDMTEVHVRPTDHFRDGARWQWDQAEEAVTRAY